MIRLLRLTCLLTAFIFCHHSWAQVTLTSSPYTQDFNTLVSSSTGTWSDNTTLAGWYAKTDLTASITSCNANTGTTTAAGLYSFGTTSVTDRALGYAPSNAFFGASGVGKGYIGLRLKNNAGAPISSITVVWTGEEWRKENNAASQSLTLSYQTGTTVTDLTAGTWISTGSTFTSPIFAATTATALDGNVAANRTAAISKTIAVSLAAGDEIMLRWEDLNDSGNDHQLAIDDVSVSFVVDTTPPTFTSTYPQSANISSTSFDLVVNLDEAGKVYYVVLADGATAPTAAQVKAGQDDQGNPVANSGSFSVATSATNFSKTISGLSSTTNYDIYVVAEDGVPNLQASATLVNVMTNASPSITPSISSYSFPGLTSKVGQSASTSYTVSASNLVGDVSVSVSGNFLISSDNSTFSTALDILAADLSSPQTVYVKFDPSGAIGTVTGTITHSSSGASDKTISLSAVAIDPFNQNFNDPAFLTNSGWTQYSVTGAQVWASTNFGHTCLTGCNNATVDKAAQINGFSGSAQNNEDWLISPPLDLTGFVNYPAVSFATISAFAGDQLQLKYSTNYSGSGDPSVATWVSIDGKFPESNSSLWTTSSNIILPKSLLYVAFVYTSNTTAASRWTLDDWKVEDISSFLDVPSINLSFGEVTTGNTSSSQNFNFTANGYGDITVSVPTGFEVSLDNATFSSNVIVSAANASASQTIYVRFAPPSKALKWTGAISFTGTGLNTSSGTMSGSSYPKSETFNVATYNMEFFGTDVRDATNVEFGPTDDALQVANVTTVMQTVAADVFAVEEISDDNALAQLVSNLSGYDKVISDRWSYSWQAPDPNFPPQKTGFIYNTSKMQLISSRVMFASLYDSIIAGTKTLPAYPTGTSSNFWSSGRLPFMATFDVTVNGIKRRIRLIDIHGKSEGSGSWDRRVYDSKVLHDSLVAHYPHDNIILLGDFNDQVYNSITSGKISSYDVFVSDANNFKAVTYDLNVAGASTYPSSASFIDNIIVSNELVNAYVTNSVTVEDPRGYINNYSTTTSDHLPVWSRFLLSSKADQTLMFNTLPSKTFGDANFALTATASSGLTATFTSSDPSIASVSGNVVSILKAGSVTITASQSGSSDFNAAASVDQSLTINKANQAITFGALANKKFGDADFALSGAASSSLTVAYQSSDPTVASISGNTVSIHKTGSVTITATQSGSNDFNAATSVDQSLTIDKADQTITFTALAGKRFGDADFALSGTASSGLPVTYQSSDVTIASVSGTTVSIHKAGSVTITASQSGSSDFNAAATVDQLLIILKADQTISFTTLANKKFGDADFTLTDIASSGLALTYQSSDPTIASINGNTVSIHKTGTITITTSQPGNNDYNAAVSFDRSLTIDKGDQTITFTGLASKKFGDADFMLSGTASSGLTVAYQSSDPTIASINGNTVSIHKAGSVNITASQAGDANYNAATGVTQSLVIAKSNQTITFNALGPVAQDAAPFVLTASASSNLAVTYSSDNTAVATIQGNTVTITGLGSVNITASQAGNENYNAATSVTRQLVVTTVTGIEPSASSLVRVYPNPTNSTATIEVPGGETGVVEMKLINMMGEVIVAHQVQLVDGKITIDLNSVQPGMYLVSITTSVVQSTQRIIKK